MSSLPATSHHLMPVGTRDDRPVSVYDNLNSPTHHHPATPIYSTPVKTKYNSNVPISPYMNLPQRVSSPTTVTALPLNDYKQFSTPVTNTSTPIKRNSDSYDSSLSRAAVKAAMNEAKSKFFGLPTDPTQTTYLLPQTHPNPVHTSRYENIPANSAVFYPPEYRRPEPTDELDGRCPREVSPGSNEGCPNGIDKNGVQSRFNKSLSNGLDLGNPPSQEVYMKTTVPQNIRGVSIAGRHTPTRTSLRHSRMLVMSKGYNGPHESNPLNLLHPTLAKVLLVLQVIFGIAIGCLGGWILFWAPNTRLQDNPYWSGVSLLLAGVLGLLLIRCRRINRSKVRKGCFTFVKFDSFLLSLIAALLCIIACICATVHVIRLTAEDTNCEPSSKLVSDSSCTCIFNFKNMNDSQTVDRTGEFGFLGDNYLMEYPDLPCKDVTGAWIFVQSFSMVLNILGCTFTLMYLSLVMCFRISPEKYYTSVQTSVR